MSTRYLTNVHDTDCHLLSCEENGATLTYLIDQQRVRQTAADAEMTDVVA